MHYMNHEMERTMKEHIPVISFVVVDGNPIFVKEETIDLSKSLSRLTAMV